MLTYRLLTKAEISQLQTINREEIIENVYYMRDDQLVLEPEYFHCPGWHPEEIKELIPRVENLHDRGGTVYGALDGSTIVGMVALDCKFIGSRHDQLKLDILYTDSQYRKLGIGRKLMELAIERARELGAARLYISATPTENTVNFYMSLGAVLTAEIDPELFQLEPYDIHLELKL